MSNMPTNSAQPTCNCHCRSGGKERLFTQNREGIEIGLLLLGVVLGSVGSLAFNIALRVSVLIKRILASIFCVREEVCWRGRR